MVMTSLFWGDLTREDERNFVIIPVLSSYRNILIFLSATVVVVGGATLQFLLRNFLFGIFPFLKFSSDFKRKNQKAKKAKKEDSL